MQEILASKHVQLPSALILVAKIKGYFQLLLVHVLDNHTRAIIPWQWGSILHEDMRQMVCLDHMILHVVC
jgi:hypothetical protein